MKKQQLSLNELKHGLFVLIEIHPDVFEIGIVKVDGDNKQISTLTDAAFNELPIVFNPEWPPFFAQGMLHLNPEEYASYTIDQEFVQKLITEQLNYLKGRYNSFNEKISLKQEIMEANHLRNMQYSIDNLRNERASTDAMISSTTEISEYIEKIQNKSNN